MRLETHWDVVELDLAPELRQKNCYYDDATKKIKKKKWKEPDAEKKRPVALKGAFGIQTSHIAWFHYFSSQDISLLVILQDNAGILQKRSPLKTLNRNVFIFLVSVSRG